MSAVSDTERVGRLTDDRPTPPGPRRRLDFFVFAISIFDRGRLDSGSLRTVELVVTVIAIILAAPGLVLDFGTIEAGVEAHAPKENEWCLVQPDGHADLAPRDVAPGLAVLSPTR